MKLTQDYHALHEHITNIVLANPMDAIQSLNEFKEQPRYQDDEPYRLVVDTGVALYHEMFDNYQESISIINSVLPRAAERGLWDVVIYNYNTLGNIYYALRMLDKSFESLMFAINLEKKHNLYQMTAPAYNNIGLIYQVLDESNSYKYFERAYNHLKAHSSKISRSASKFSHSLSNYIIQLCKNGTIEVAGEHFDELVQLKNHDVDKYGEAIIDKAMMFYYYSTNEYNKGKLACIHAQKLYESINDEKDNLKLIIDFVKLSLKHRLDYKFFIDELINLESHESTYYPGSMMQVYELLIEYYSLTKQHKKINECYIKYIFYNKKSNEIDKSQRLQSLDVVIQHVNTKAKNELITQKNEELNRLTNALIESKQALEESSAQIAMINEMGHRIVSSLDLSVIVNMVYGYLKKSVALTGFALLLENKAMNHLESIIYYENDTEQDVVSVSLEVEYDKSLFVKCFYTAEIIVINNLQNHNQYSRKNSLYSSQQEIKSAIFFPIIYKSNTLGVCSIQSEKANAYSDKEISFIKLLSPYLAISISNAQHSNKLKNEISAHEITQQKLEAVNNKLKKLSSLDGLTKVCNRREFNRIYNELLNRASQENLPIALYMMDIDHFKKFNDRYGHLEGDQALQAVAKKVNLAFEDKDSVFARFGGEEFIAVSIGKSPEHYITLAEQVRNAIANLAIENHDTEPGFLTISIGLVISDNAHLELKPNLMKQADLSLYRAKESGRNRVEHCFVK